MLSSTLLTFEDVLHSYTSYKHGLQSLSFYNHWFPLKSSPRLAGIIADLFGDGHLQGEPRWRIDYTSKRLVRGSAETLTGLQSGD